MKVRVAMEFYHCGLSMDCQLSTGNSFVQDGHSKRALLLVLVEMFSHLIFTLPDDITSWDPPGAGISANPG